jgi:glutamine amidotransferase
MKKCLILDYGVGNIASLTTFFREHNYIVSFGNKIEEVENTELLILPGVGSFRTAVENINKSGVATAIQDRHFKQKPIIGICLGFQLLTKESEESPSFPGLNIFNGFTRRLEEFSRIGWDKINFEDYENCPTNDYFYFNHSFGIYELQNFGIKAFAGTSQCCALFIENSTVGVQFHPERSQNAGKEFIIWLEKEIWNLND